jgi:hypothetical protein
VVEFVECRGRTCYGDALLYEKRPAAGATFSEGQLRGYGGLYMLALLVPGVRQSDFVFSFVSLLVPTHHYSY